MLIIPAIDLREGKCVRLVEGKLDRETIYSEDPVAMAAHWQEKGAQMLHVVDLDGSLCRFTKESRRCKGNSICADNTGTGWRRH